MNSHVTIKALQADFQEASESGIALHQDSEAQAHLKTYRIAVISDAAPERNGVGTYYVDLVGQLQSRLDNIELFCPTIENGKWRAGLVFPLPGDATQKLCMPNPFTMRKFLRRVKPDLIVIATPGVYGLVGAYFAKKMKIPAVAGFHTSFEQITDLYWRDSIAGKIVHWYFRVSNNYLFNRCETVMANSEDMIEQAKKLNPKSVRLISTVISSKFADVPLADYTGQCKNILFAGRLAPEKNIDTIVDAAKQHPGLQFNIAGDGPQREEFERKVEGLNNVKMLGWLNREALRQVIDENDALILPSHFESFGTIALEAMARKRLVIVSQGCGIAEWKDYAEGFFTMQSAELAPTLGEIKALSDEQRLAKATRAREITQAINEKNLQVWYSILKEHCPK